MTGRNENQLSFGEWLGEHRRNSSHDEVAMAKLIGVSPNTYRRWEAGQIRWEILNGEFKDKIRVVFGDYDDYTKISSDEVILSRDGNEPSVRREVENGIHGDLIESICARCPTPIRIKDNGRCPECGRHMDNGW